MSSLSSSHQPHSSSEIQLLLACARTDPTDSHLEVIHTCGQQLLDWPYLIDVAWKHGVGPLLFRNLKQANLARIPADILSTLENLYRQNWVKNQMLAHELIDIVKAFQSGNLSIFPFKGPVLATAAYRDLALRQFSDLDLLVSKIDLTKASEILRSLGYQGILDTPGEERREPGDSDLYHVFSRDRGSNIVRVDLQWSIAGPHFSFNIDHLGWWKRGIDIPMLDSNIPSLSAEDLLLVLCVHGAKHEWERLAWVCDVAELVKAQATRFDWDYVLTEGGRLGALGMVWSGLSLAHQLLGETPPQHLLEIRKQLEPLGPESLVVIRNRMLAEEPIDRPQAETLLWYLSIRERWQDRLRYYLYYIRSDNLPKENWTRFPYPILYSIFHYLFQLGKFIGKHGLPSGRLKRKIFDWLYRMD